jgi:hypothetical protein
VLYHLPLVIIELDQIADDAHFRGMVEQLNGRSCSLDGAVEDGVVLVPQVVEQIPV